MLNPFRKSLSFEPVRDDDDELIRAISNDPNLHDNLWELKDDINPDELNHFWDKALSELEPDDFDK